jgi:hypothetical protein
MATKQWNIIPYYKRTKKGDSIDITVLWIFMKDGGKTIWKTDEECTQEKVIREYIEENGFIGKITKYTENSLYYEIDTEKTNMENYYRWLDDGSEDMDIWRPWFVFTGSKMEFPPQIQVLRDEIM